MASKYLQKYQVPEGFYDILHEFTREVLRAQPDDILDYAANYFEHKSEGREYYYESKHNVQKTQAQKPKQYNPTPHSNYSEQAKRVVEASNAKAAVAAAAAAATAAENAAQQQKPSRQSSGQPSRQDISVPEGYGRPLTSNSIKSDKPNDISRVSKKSDISHPEEKKISKEFVDDLYSSAMHQALGSVSVENEEEQVEESAQETPQESQQEEVQQKPKQEEEEVILDGPVEEYQNVALKIQSVFRGNQVRKQKK